MKLKTNYQFSTERLQRINRLLQGYIDRKELPCASVLVGMGGEVLYKEKFGWLDIEAGIPVQFDTIFRIMSMSKPVTAVAAMLLYEQGLFDLNTPIHRFLPGFKNMKILKPGKAGGSYEFDPAKTPITFRHLFTHTSGIGYGGLVGDQLSEIYQPIIEPILTGKKTVTIQESAEILATLPLAFDPGSSWCYGLNLDVLCCLVEVLSDMPFQDYLEKRIFQPLEMTETGFNLSADKMPRLAVVYLRDEKASGLTRQAIPLPMTAMMWGGGGLVSTLDDYSHFASMLANEGKWAGTQLLSPTTVAMFGQNWAPPETLPAFQSLSPEINAGYGYSLGTAVLVDPSPTGKFGNIGEFYWGGAFGTYFFVDPQESIYAVFMTQLNPNWAYPIPWQLKQLIYQALV